MNPSIMTRTFLLAGYETSIDLNTGFGERIDKLRAQLRENLHRIGHLCPSGRLVGFWTGDPAVDYSDPQNHSMRMYFFGVEIAGADAVPADCVIRCLPESAYAVFREARRGTAPKWEWLATSGYHFNAEVIPGDLEVFDGWDHTGADCPCDILVPIK